MRSYPPRVHQDWGGCPEGQFPPRARRASIGRGRAGELPRPMRLGLGKRGVKTAFAYHSIFWGGGVGFTPHLPNHDASLAFAQGALLHHVVEQLASLHDLHHHVDLHVRLEHILHVDDVGVSKELQDLDGNNRRRTCIVRIGGQEKKKN